jgi:hypothetical protein
MTYFRANYQLLNAKVAVKLLKKLGIADITHAKDGIEGLKWVALKLTW